jgi:hypothetical protein
MMATQDFGGLLFGMGGSGLEEYLTPAQTQGIQNQAMLQAASALLQAGGPSARPVSLGQALGGALQAGQQGYSQAQTGAINTLMAQQKLREAKLATDLQKQVAATFAEPMPTGDGTTTMKPEDIKYNQYMKLANMYAASGKSEEAKRFQDMAYQIKPRDEIVFQDLGGRTVAVNKSQLRGGESFNKTIGPQVVGNAETGFYVVGGGGGGVGGGVAPAPAGGQRPTTPPVGTTIMRPDYVPPSAAPAPAGGQSVIQPRATGLQPIIAGTGSKPTEAFMKASKQLNDLQGALTDYKDELKKDITVYPTNIPVPFTDSGVPLPTGADTARMSGKYNSLLMGVKNLYELGALTGPDMSIIERQFTNPASFTGAITSRKAMDEQVKVLEDMLTRAKENLSTSYRQTVPAAAGVTEWVWQDGKLVPKK